MAIPTEPVQPTLSSVMAFIPFDIFPILRIGLIVFLFFYLVLALMVIKQISMMTKTIRSSGDGFLFMLAYLHLLVVFVTLLFSLFVL